MPAKSSSVSLAPVARNTLQEQIHAQLRESLSDGRFKPGEILTIKDLAQQLGTSVMPVREAIHKLTVEQLLDITVSRSIRVPELSAHKFAEICASRMVLEGELAALAAERADADDLYRIERAEEAMSSPRTPRDPSLSLKRNREFHFAVYQAAHNSTMFELVEPLWVRLGPSMLALYEELGTEQKKKAAREPHRTTIRGILARRPEEARRGIVEDIRATTERYRRHLEIMTADRST